jgi:hypothetical protein
MILPGLSLLLSRIPTILYPLIQAMKRCIQPGRYQIARLKPRLIFIIVIPPLKERFDEPDDASHNYNSNYDLPGINSVH